MVNISMYLAWPPEEDKGLVIGGRADLDIEQGKLAAARQAWLSSLPSGSLGSLTK